MESPHKQVEKGKVICTNISSLKNNLCKDIIKGSFLNKKKGNFNNKDNNKISSNFRKEPNKEKKINNNQRKKKYIRKNDSKMTEEEEEEINSNEYISSTNLEVDTLTYINSKDNRIDDDEKNLNKNTINKNIIHYPGRLKNKIINNNSYNIMEVNKKEEDYNLKSIDKEAINNCNLNTFIVINNNTIKDNNHNNIRKIDNNKSDFIYNTSKSNTKDKNNNSNSLDKKCVFTPNNEGKKKVKVLREIIFKKLQDHLKKNNIKNNQQSRTINIIENKNVNNLKLINNQIIKNYIKLNLNLNIKKRNNLLNYNNNITNNSIVTKNVSINEFQENIQSNNIADIAIYKKNIIQDFCEININDQKYHIVPKSIKMPKTQGRVGKLVYNKKNNRNNFLYKINFNKNNQNAINKTINTPLSISHYKKINRISPINTNNSNNYYSICANKINNFHSLKNLKIDNVQKSLKTYLLVDEYKNIISNNREKINDFEKEQIKKTDKKNKKFFKNLSHKSKNINNINVSNNKIKKIIKNEKNVQIPLNINKKTQLRSFNSCYPKRINPNVFNNHTTEQILSTISSNYNNEQNSEIFIKNNYVYLTKSKYRNISDKKYSNEKKINKKGEISYNILPDYCKKNILSFKTIKNLKNKIFSSDFSNVDNQNNKKSHINTVIKKNKPLTNRIKLDLINEENKNNSKINTKNNMANDNTETINRVSNIDYNYSITKKKYYENINKDLNFKTLPYKCLSPNLHNAKHFVKKNHPLKIKEMYYKINNNNKGRNTYNIFLSSSMMENNNSKNISNNNSNFIPGNFDGIILLKKYQKEN